MTNAVNIAQLGSNNVTMRNRIINGAMMIDQRNNGAAVTAGFGYSVDRWQIDTAAGTGGKINQQRNAGSVTPPPGCINYLGMTSTSSYSVLTGDAFALIQRIEGLNVADLGFGTANAQPVTVSFWVRSSLTGTFGGSLINSAGNRSYPFAYTISAANTWEQKSVTIPGDTSGTWLTTNGTGITLSFGLGSGSTYSGTAGAWASSYFYTATGAVSVVGTNAATFYITGVQLEEGTAASPFENRLYGTELALCQRYFQKSYNTDVALGTATTAGCITNQAQANVTFVPMIWNFPVIMRATPTLTAYSTNSGASGKFYSNAPAGDFNISAGFIGASGGSVNSGGTSITATGYVATQLAVTAEL